jgi:hypothetical protein
LAFCFILFLCRIENSAKFQAALQMPLSGGAKRAFFFILFLCRIENSAKFQAGIANSDMFQAALQMPLSGGIGGLGIHLVKNLTETFTYRREGSRNITRMSIRYP